MFISPLMYDSESQQSPVPESELATQSALPSPSELFDSNRMPVDNDLQYLVPTLLRMVLHHHWRQQPDWFFGINMNVYYSGPGFYARIPVLPDAFISLGVKPSAKSSGRLSYLVWQEHGIVPLWVLECVSQETDREEYDEKMKIYACMGVIHYVIYNPHHYRRDRHNPLEVYHLVQGRYQRRLGYQIWFPELQLALGRDVGTFQNWTREWLYWYDQTGKRLLLPEEELAQTRQQLVQVQQRAERLAQLLRDRGIEVDLT
jgi:Uma2 family endonuclease